MEAVPKEEQPDWLGWLVAGFVPFLPRPCSLVVRVFRTLPQTCSGLHITCTLDGSSW
jgi:hypothetical protein